MRDKEKKGVDNSGFDGKKETDIEKGDEKDEESAIAQSLQVSQEFYSRAARNSMLFRQQYDSPYLKAEIKKWSSLLDTAWQNPKRYAEIQDKLNRLYEEKQALDEFNANAACTIAALDDVHSPIAQSRIREDTHEITTRQRSFYTAMKSLAPHELP